MATLLEVTQIILLVFAISLIASVYKVIVKEVGTHPKKEDDGRKYLEWEE